MLYYCHVCTNVLVICTPAENQKRVKLKSHWNLVPTVTTLYLRLSWTVPSAKTTFPTVLSRCVLAIFIDIKFCKQSLFRSFYHLSE